MTFDSQVPVWRPDQADIAERSSDFQLKEPGNGYSVIRAEVRVKGRVELAPLCRFINPHATGPRLEEILRHDLDA
jgi:hypothetical protein